MYTGWYMKQKILKANKYYTFLGQKLQCNMSSLLLCGPTATAVGIYPLIYDPLIYIQDIEANPKANNALTFTNFSTCI